MMPENSTRTDGPSPDTMELWRNWLTETERQWNSFFSEVMGRDSFGRVTGSYMEMYSVVQRALNQGMERYLNTFNLPTRSDVVELGERLHNIEERLATLEANISNLASAAGIETSASVTQLRPRRTRRPRTPKNESK
jgi:polyhydroxyalkanoic acid synthase PhaR subunit